jgi:uncharacterized GH25 family protein
MKSTKWLLSVFAACALLMVAGGAMAHNLWLVPDQYNPQVGGTVKILVGFGHHFPASRMDEKVRPGMLQEVNAVGPNGKVTILEKKAEGEYAFTVKAPGPYLISVLMKPGFFSRVPGGMKRGNKKELAQVQKCMFFRMIGNAPIFAGAAGQKTPAAPASQALQMQPLKDLAKLKQGDTLPIKVMFQGAPLANAVVTATYAGYKPSKEAMAKANKPEPNLSPKEAARLRMKRKLALLDLVKVKTDSQGVAQIKLSAKGWWLVLVANDTPFKDAATCDRNMFKTSYTFEVR